MQSSVAVVIPIVIAVVVVVIVVGFRLIIDKYRFRLVAVRLIFVVVSERVVVDANVVVVVDESFISVTGLAAGPGTWVESRGGRGSKIRRKQERRRDASRGLEVLAQVKVREVSGKVEARLPPQAEAQDIGASGGTNILASGSVFVRGVLNRRQKRKRK